MTSKRPAMARRPNPTPPAAPAPGVVADARAAGRLQGVREDRQARVEAATSAGVAPFCGP